MKYKKITKEQVLEVYYNTQSTCYSKGIWADYVPTDFIAHELNTSKYQVRKLMKELMNEGFLEFSKVCTYAEEYYNGLYDVEVPILYAKVYTLSDKAIEYFAEKNNEVD